MNTLTIVKPTPDLLAASVLLERTEVLAELALEAEDHLSLERWQATLCSLASRHLEALLAVDAAQVQNPDTDLSALRTQMWLLENESHLASYMRENLTTQQCIALVADQLDSIDATRKMIADLERRAAA